MSMSLSGKIYRNAYYHTVLKYLEFQNSRKKNIDKGSTLTIFSSPRGGSTWLAELLSRSIAHSTLLLEPLYRGQYQTSGRMPSGHKARVPVDKLGYWYYQPIMEDEDWPESLELFRSLLNRENLALSMVYENELRQIAGSDHFIYKFCYGHLLMPWMVKHFDVSCIFLTRHPGAVIASQLRHGGWNHLQAGDASRFILPTFRNSDFFEKYKHITEKIRTPEENLAAMWAISVGSVMAHPKNNVAWKTISYEGLFMDPEETLVDVLEYLGKPYSEKALDDIRKPSKTTNDASYKDLSNNTQLESWRRKLSSKQVERISDILHEFEIDFYSMDEIMPNFSNTAPKG